MRLVAASLAVVAGASVLQRPPSLSTVIERASRFAVQQRDALTSVRAEEDYTQELRSPAGRVLQTRRLESEIAFVRLSDSEDWLAFRSVIRVDGAPTGTDTARLEKLFRDGAASQQGRRIAEENTIYNIGRLQRELNIPTFVTHLLMPQHYRRFRFKKVGEDSSGATPAWIVSYEERKRPTVLRTPNFRDVPLEGRLWIAVDDGRVLRATVATKAIVKTELEFTWRHDAGLDAWVPASMQERYRDVQDAEPPWRTYDIVAVATYANYRRFGVEFRIK